MSGARRNWRTPTWIIYFFLYSSKNYEGEYMRITKKMYEEHISKMEDKYQKCPKCNRKRDHIIGIHTFQCECGEREWYPERLGDEDFTADWGEVIKQM